MELAGGIEGALAALGVKPVEVGLVRRRSVPVGSGISDDAVVARWTIDRATVMTHGGAAVVDGLLAACAAAGITVEGRASDSDQYPEAANAVEARMLSALARAQSPAAVDLLLDQPRRWALQSGTLPAGQDTERDAALRRLIEPALVVVVGPPNIGKSSLLNALAGRGVAVVADQPGTTRDHVGALIDLGGVVVRWADTPGLAERSCSNADEDAGIQAEAQRLARDVAQRADVLVVCRDHQAGLDQLPATRGTVVRAGLRSDLGEVAGMDASVSVRAGHGLANLVDVVRDAVVPRRWMDDDAPWRFW